MTVADDALAAFWQEHLADAEPPEEFLGHSPVRIAFGSGKLKELGPLARAEGATRVLVVTDPGIVAAGHVAKAVESLQAASLHVTVFDRAAENPTTHHVDAGLAVARDADVDLLVAIGGGSAMDCAKGINLLLTNGGRIQDYWGINKATAPMLPSIAVPTTAGTGSEAQSFALISDPVSHQKMACGDRRSPDQGGLRPRLAILDPELTASQPPRVAAASGIDAIAHAVETAGTTERTPMSIRFSQAAWRLLSGTYEPGMRRANRDDRACMLLGAHLAGAAIEQSMLGAAHACANPLTARFGLAHGVAVGVLLPAVVQYNTDGRENPYNLLEPDAAALVQRLRGLLAAGDLPGRLRDCRVPEPALSELAFYAAEQWTAKFNPRPVDAPELLEIFRQAY